MDYGSVCQQKTTVWWTRNNLLNPFVTYIYICQHRCHVRPHLCVSDVLRGLVPTTTLNGVQIRPMKSRCHNTSTAEYESAPGPAAQPTRKRSRGRTTQPNERSQQSDTPQPSPTTPSQPLPQPNLPLARNRSRTNSRAVAVTTISKRKQKNVPRYIARCPHRRCAKTKCRIWPQCL